MSTTASSLVHPGAIASKLEENPSTPYLDGMLRYPKRKRKPVKYVQSESEADGSSDSDIGSLPVKKRVKRSVKPLAKNKIFQFLLLPPELRNKIYEECLKVSATTHEGGEEGIWLQEKQKSYRRGVQRIVPIEADQRPYGCYQRQAPLGQATPESESEERLMEQRTLNLNLLAVCRQIYCEAAPMLYSQRIVLLDTAALVFFIGQLSSRTAQLLQHLEICGWISTRSRKSMGYLGMLLLAAKGVFNLDKLHINCSIGHFYSHPASNLVRSQPLAKRVARKLYRDCHPWLEAYEAHRAMKSEEKTNGTPWGIDILEIDESNFGLDKSRVDEDFKHIYHDYRKELWRLIRC